MKWNVLKAIFKRDFVSYFSSPTGYVFICVFVVLSSLATFWPPEFFTNNLANLDQLSRWLPFIMLVFIPAITMSIWAEERRQGTDELLLTIPASDFDVVLGKYLAGVAIFTVSLLFSALSIFTVFKYGLGDPDPGLFFSTYVGYWFIGVAMIAIGMVASFLTSNLTVGFILGTLFNMPLALSGEADWIVKDQAWADRIRQWSAFEQFADFKRGVLSLGGMTYFVMIVVVMIYLSMVFIGRRHWQAREDGQFLLGHYLLRAVALMALAAGVTVLIQNRNWLRADVSTEQLSSLSQDSLNLLNSLRNNKEVESIKIDAYVSPYLPAEYAQTKLNLYSTLEEIRARGGSKIIVRKHEIPTYGPEAELAEKNFGITPQTPMTTDASEEQEEFFLGFAVTSGLDNVVTQFLNKGIPVEYELIRSIMTVADKKRLKVGVVDTGIPMMGSGGSPRGEWPLIGELRKQYDVTSVDPSQPIKKTFNALLVVQPTMLNPDAYDNVIDAIRSGIPTAVLEDPLPYFYPEFVPGTGQPKQSQMGGMAMFGGGQMEPKGDPNMLWKLLGVEVNPMNVVFQEYAPEQSVRQWQDLQWVFIDHSNGAPEPFNNQHRLTQGLNQVLFLYPGGIAKKEDSKLKFEQLVQTGVGNSGTVPAMMLQRFDSERANSNRNLFQHTRTKDGYILAAQITGTPPEDDAALAALAVDDEHDPADSPDAKKKASGADAKPMKVILVADIDWIIPSFFFIREGGDENFLPATQNVPFILNIIDTLAGDERFIEIRKRARIHRTLEKIDEATRTYRERAAEDREKFVKDLDEKENAAREAMQKKIDEVESSNLGSMEKDVLLEQVRIREQQKLDAEVRALADERRTQTKKIKYDMDQDVRAVQDQYKMYAILIPPIPPLLLALAVFFRRRELERQGVSRERLR